MLKIWGRMNSINVQKVLWCCGELGLEYERIDAGMQFGVNNTPEYKAMNPNGLVPTIDDEGFILWESHAIVRYLARKHGMGTPVAGRRSSRAADADRWMEWYSTTLWPVRAADFLESRSHRARQAQHDGGRGMPPETRGASHYRRCAPREPRLFRGQHVSPWETFRWGSRASAGSICRSSGPRCPISSAGSGGSRERPAFQKHCCHAAHVSFACHGASRGLRRR